MLKIKGSSVQNAFDADLRYWGLMTAECLLEKHSTRAWFCSFT